jgi:hypothetical protein
MTPLETLLARLPDVGKASKGWLARCPAHDDRRASLSLSEGDDGTALVKCHAGCDTPAILVAIGMKLADLFPAKVGPSRNGKPKSSGKTFPTAKDAVMALERHHGKRSALWTYHDDQGEPVGLVIRWDRPEGKDIRPVSLHKDGWRIGAVPDPRPLYGLPKLAMAGRVIVVEGEKAAEAARALGFTATTSAGGSQAATKTDWRPLAGKEVWVFPDNDPPGRRYADTVAGILAKLTQSSVVRIIELPGLPEAGDIVDWIDAHGDAAEPDGMRAEIEALAQTLDIRASIRYNPDMETKRTQLLTDQLRQAIDDSGLTRYQIAKATGIDESALAKFYNGHRGLSMDALNALGEFLHLTIILGNKPRKKGE